MFTQLLALRGTDGLGWVHLSSVWLSTVMVCEVPCMDPIFSPFSWSSYHTSFPPHCVIVIQHWTLTHLLEVNFVLFLCY